MTAVHRRRDRHALGVARLAVLLALARSPARDAARRSDRRRVDQRAPPADAAATRLADDGILTDIDSEGLTRVTGFRLRTDDGQEIAFKIGTLENGAEFPPGHLAEHMATSSPVRVYLPRATAGSLVVVPPRGRAPP